MTNEIKICESCGSSNIYGSPNGYDSVIKCRDCHAETHAPEIACLEELEVARVGVEKARAALRDLIERHGGQRHHVPGLEDSRPRSPELKEIVEGETRWNKEVARLLNSVDRLGIASEAS